MTAPQVLETRRSWGRRARIWGGAGLLVRAAHRALLLALLWWALTGGTHDAWRFGVPVILLATAASLWLQPRRRVRVSAAGLLRFLAFFFRQSLRGGIDVARRALHPRRPLAPALLEYRLRLRDVSACVLLANTISLLPGTLSAALEDDRLTVHALDSRLPVHESLREAEARVAALLGLELASSAEASGPG